jgi:plastocyanin
MAMNLDRRTLLAAGAAALGCSAASSARAVQAHSVVVADSGAAFDPASVSIKVGDSVEWENTAIVLHTVTCDPAQAKKAADASLPAGAAVFDSGKLAADQKFAHRFDQAGTYRYFCKYHEDMGMVATVVVSM